MLIVYTELYCKLHRSACMRGYYVECPENLLCLEQYCKHSGIKEELAHEPDVGEGGRNERVRR